MKPFEGKTIEQVVKKAEEILSGKKECLHKNRGLLFTHYGSEYEKCRDCGYEE